MLAPGLAGAVSPAQCGRLTRQIEHFEDMSDRARQAGNQMWVDGMEGHLRLLKRERLNSCEAFAKEDQAIAAFGHFLKLAAEGAVSYFTGGIY
jgi:hypothetical protein